MQFTGRNLRTLQGALVRAIGEVQGEIGSCPDVFEYEDELKDLDDELAVYQCLLDRISRFIDSKESP